MSKRSRRRERQRRLTRLRQAEEFQAEQGDSSAEPQPAQARAVSSSPAQAVRDSRQRAPRKAGGSPPRRVFRVPKLDAATMWVLGSLGLIVLIVAIYWVRQGGSGEASGGAQVGDHWHASIAIQVCGESYVEPSFEGGIHTHGDGQIHLHPRSLSEAGRNASLKTYFENSRLQIGQDFIQIPGEQRLRNGDPCPDGKPGHLRVTVNGREVQNFLSYLPKEGDRIQVTFN